MKQDEVDTFLQNLTSELQEKLGHSAEEVKPIKMDEPQFKEYVTIQTKKMEELRSSTLDNLQEKKALILAQINV